MCVFYRIHVSEIKVYRLGSASHSLYLILCLCNIRQSLQAPQEKHRFIPEAASLFIQGVACQYVCSTLSKP